MTIDGVFYSNFQLPTSWHAEANGALQLPADSIGDPNTAADDVLVDDRIVLGQDYDSATAFGQVLAQQLLDD